MRRSPNQEVRHPVVIIGAGPYGLSIAAHLDEAGIPYRIFGGAMQMWREHMPAGMTMKSDGFASNLSAGRRRQFTFRQFCEERSIPYVDRHFPMPLEHFIAYGLEFQKRFVHRLDSRHVAQIARVDRRAQVRTNTRTDRRARNLSTTTQQFKVTLEDGETLTAGSVICATGIMHFPVLPSELDALPPESVSHTSDHATYANFSDQKVAVLGAGASAMHAAALLHEHGADVTVIARRSKIIFHDAPTGKERPLLQRLMHPSSKLGTGMKSFLSEKAPQVFYQLPETLRHTIVRKHLGPSSSWNLKDRVVGKARLLLGSRISHAEATGSSIKLTVAHEDRQEEVIVDHVLAGTGFRVNIQRLAYLKNLLGDLDTINGAPNLDRRFQSSIPGLFFVGTPSAPSFGPLLRFAAGSDFAARVLTRALKPTASPVPGKQAWQVNNERPHIASRP